MSKITGVHYLRSETLVCQGGNGVGSTYTAIKRYNTPVTNTFSALGTWTDSATLGGFLTLLKPCTVHVQVSMGNVTTNSVSGAAISLNATASECATVAQSMASQVNIVAMLGIRNVAGIMGNPYSTGYTGKLAIGDVLRAHVVAPPDNDTPSVSNYNASIYIRITLVEI